MDNRPERLITKNHRSKVTINVLFTCPECGETDVLKIWMKHCPICGVRIKFSKPVKEKKWR